MSPSSLLPFNYYFFTLEKFIGISKKKKERKSANDSRTQAPIQFHSAESTPQYQLEFGPAKSERGGFSRYCGCAAAGGFPNRSQKKPTPRVSHKGSLRPALLFPLNFTHSLGFPSGHSGYLIPRAAGNKALPLSFS